MGVNAGVSTGERTGGHVAFVDGLRAIAVLGVILYHDSFGSANRPMWANSGARGVDLFFAISGFCLAYPFLQKWRSGSAVTIDVGVFVRFMFARLSRIAPPYYVALGLFALLALTSFGFPDASRQNVSALTATREMFADIAFLTGKSPIFNASFWTLGIEMRWYLLCPLFIGLYMRSRPFFVAVLIALYGLYFLSPWPTADEGTLPGFMLGLVAADLHVVEHRARRYAWIPAVALLTIGVLFQAYGGSLDLGNPVWHLASFFLILAASDRVLERILTWRPLTWIGICSYSIYLIHGPIVREAILLGTGRIVAPMVALAASIAFYYLVEARVTKRPVRRRIESALGYLIFGIGSRFRIRERA